jgi:UDP-N-acetylglucosamine:LPS N-acetylglucosamine transferase
LAGSASLLLTHTDPTFGKQPPQEEAMKKKPKLIIVLGSGGHTAQMARLTEMLYDTYDFEYVINDDDNTSINKIKYLGDLHIVPRPRRKNDKAIIRSVCLTMYSIVRAFCIVMNSASIGIVSAGPGLSIPLFLWALIFGKKRIFIESWSRVTTKSVTGKICYYLSNQFFVQWPELIKIYPKAIYAGRLG